MDLPQLVQVLQACLSSNPAAAEETLKQYQTAPGQAGNLLRVAVEESVNEEVRQVASIYFKNLVKRHWEVHDPEAGTKSFELSEADKQVVRENLVECLIRSPHKVQLQLGEALKIIVSTDFPQKWPGLLTALHQNLTSPEPARVSGGLVGFRWLCRKYQLSDDNELAQLESLVQTGFPVLLQFMQQLLQGNTFSQQAAEALKIICKCFYYVTYLNVPAQLSSKEMFLSWMAAIRDGLLKPIPKEVQPQDEAERSKWCWWKTKKWFFRLSYRLMMRIRSVNAASEDNKEVAKLYATECLPTFVAAHMQVMADYAAGTWLSPQVLALNLQFLTEGVKVSASYQLMKPHLDSMVANVVFPLTFFNAQDNELWVNDPHEYVRRGYEAFESMYDVKVAAINFLHELCNNRPKAHLDKVMGVVLQVLNASAAERAAGALQPETAARLDGALLVIGSMYATLRKKKPYKSQLEMMVVTHVAPCFTSPFGFLRAKACWVSGAYADIEFDNEANFFSLFECLIKAMSDPDLPVRVDAGSSLKDFVDKLGNSEKLKSILEPLMHNMFALMREVDSEELVATVETIIENVGEEIVPYAHTLCSSLVATLMMYSDKAENDDEDDDYIAEWAAFGCVRAINTLLSFLDDHPALFVTLEDVCYPVMQRFLSSDGQDMLDDILEMLCRFTFCVPTISPRLWSLWPKVHEVINEWGIDFWDAALRPLDNYITRATEHFITCKDPDFLASAYQMVETSLNLLDKDEEGLSLEEQVVAAPMLLNVVLQACKGRVDQWVGPYLKLVVGKMAVCKERQLKDALLSVVANAIIYNPVLTLSLLHQMGAVGPLFTEWFKMIFANKKSGQPLHFRSVMDKKVCVLALSSLLTVSDESMPPELAAGLGQLTPGIMKLLIALKEQQDKQARESDDEEEEAEDDDDDDDDDEGDMEDGEAEGEDDAYVNKLAEFSKQYAEKNKGGAAAVDDDDDDDSDLFSVDDEDFTSPLDPINPFIFFAQAVSQVQGSNSARHQVLLSHVDDRAKVALEGMMAYAQQQLQEQQAEQAKQAAA